jgi:cell wall-associated NlpC family hydrolase
MTALCAAGVFAQHKAGGGIRPPAWIQGEWRNDDGKRLFSLEMKADDILWDGGSLEGMVRAGKIRFSQKETAAGYEIYFQFLSDKYWYRERFGKPDGDSLSSSFVDSAGAAKRFTYARKPPAAQVRPPALEAEPPVEVPAPVTPAAPPPIPLPPPPSVERQPTPAAPDEAFPEEDLIRNKIIAAAHKYLGAIYVYGAQNPPRAFDCSGFVGQAYKEGVGLTLPRTAKALALTGTGVNRDSIKPADLVYFDIRGYGVISHVALVLDSRRMIHAVAEGKGMAITALDDKWYAPRIAGYRSLFSGGEIARSGGIRDGIGIGARLTDRPLSEIFIDITGKPKKTAEDIKLAPESGLHFTLTNRTGKESEFDLYFYQSGTPGNKSGHERVFLKANETKELVNAFFAEKPGRCRVEIRRAGEKSGAALVEKTWLVE